MSDRPKMLTVKQVSDIHGVSVATLRRWIAEGRINGAEQSEIKIGSGNVWLIPENAEIPVPEAAGKRHPNYEFSPKNLGISDLS